MYETTLQRLGFVRTFVVTASCISSSDENAGSRFVPVQRSSLGYGVDERRLKGDIMMDAGYSGGGNGCCWAATDGEIGEGGGGYNLRTA